MPGANIVSTFKIIGVGAVCRVLIRVGVRRLQAQQGDVGAKVEREGQDGEATTVEVVKMSFLKVARI